MNNASTPDIQTESQDFMTSLFGNPLGIVILIILFLILVLAVYILVKRFKHRHQMKKERRSLKDDLMIWSNLSKMVSGENENKQGKQNLSPNTELIKMFFASAKKVIGTRCPKKGSTPWYMVIGEPLSGKDSLFTEGQLNTYTVLHENDPHGKEPVNFHVNSERIYLSVKGRVFFDNWMGGSSAEWYTICDLIKKTHRIKPLSGIILTIPADALLADNEGLTEKKASLISSELLRLTGTIRMRIPVRVLITKSDCIRGFREFFSGVSGTGRNRTVGFSLTSNSGVYEEERFTEEWDSFISDLKETAAGMFLSKKIIDASYTDNGRIDLSSYIFTFPQQVETLRSNLRHYLKIIFNSANTGTPRVMTEGVYFCSTADQGICFDSGFAELKQATTDESPLTESHEHLKGSYFVSSVLGSSLGFLDRRADFTKSEKIRRNVPAVTIGLVLGLLTLNYLAGAILGQSLISRKLEMDTQYYKQISTLFESHAMLNSPLLDVDYNSGNGIDRFDELMENIPGVTRFNFFTNSKLTLLADRPLPMIYAPTNYLFYDYNNLYHQERQTIYNQMAADMIFFPAATSFTYNLKNNDSYYTEARADALLAFMKLSQVGGDPGILSGRNSRTIRKSLQSIVDYMYPDVSSKVAKELSDITGGNENYSASVIRQILLYKEYYPSINQGIRNLIKQIIEGNAYPESDYQTFKFLIKNGNEIKHTAEKFISFTSDISNRDLDQSIEEYMKLRREIYYTINRADYLDRNYAEFLSTFSTPVVAKKDSKDNAEAGKTLDLQRSALFEKSYLDYKNIVNDDFKEFTDYIQNNTERKRYFDSDYSDTGKVLHLQNVAADNITRDYEQTKKRLSSIINSRVYDKIKFGNQEEKYGYRVLADILKLVYATEDELPLEVKDPEYFESQFKKLESIFALKNRNLKNFMESHKNLENAKDLVNAAQMYLEYAEFVSKVQLSKNLLKHYPDDSSLTRKVADLAMSMNDAADDEDGLFNGMVNFESARRALGYFELDEQYAPKAVESFINPIAYLLQFDSRVKAKAQQKDDKNRIENKSSKLFSQYVENDKHISRIRKSVMLYSDAYVNYWAAFGDSIRPVFYDYSTFHDFTKESRAYEINAQLRDVYNMSYEVLSQIHDSVLSANGQGSRNNALKVIDSRRKLMDLNYNQACTNILNAWTLLPDDVLSANRYVNSLDKKKVRNDFTLVMAQGKSQNTLPWWDSYVRLGIRLLKSEANYSVAASLTEFQNRLYYFPVLRNGNTSGQVIVPEDMQKLRKQLLSFGIGQKKAAGNDTGKNETAASQNPQAEESSDEGVSSIQEPLLNGLKAGRSDISEWVSNVDFILKTFGSTDNPVIAKIAIPNIRTQNALIEKLYGKDYSNAMLRFRYVDIRAGKAAKKRFSTFVNDEDKVIYEDTVDIDSLELDFYRYSDDSKAGAKVAISGRYAPLKLYLDEHLIHLNNDKNNASYVPVNVLSSEGDKGILFLKVYFGQKMLAPEKWPSVENWPALSAY